MERPSILCSYYVFPQSISQAGSSYGCNHPSIPLCVNYVKRCYVVPRIPNTLNYNSMTAGESVMHVFKFHISFVIIATVARNAYTITHSVDDSNTCKVKKMDFGFQSLLRNTSLILERETYIGVCFSNDVF